MNIRSCLLTTTILAIGVAYSVQARAEVIVTASDGTTTVSANDMTNPGFAIFTATIGNFTISMNTAVGFPKVGAPSNPILDLTSVDVTTGTSGGTLTIAATETDFASTATAVQFLSSLTGNYVGSSATMNTYLDTTNMPFGMGVPLSSGLFNNQSVNSQSGVALVPPLAGPFSLTEIVTVTAGAGALASIDTAVYNAPEPGSLPVLGAALLALGLLGRNATRRPANVFGIAACAS